jgi:hypothetical protein
MPPQQRTLRTSLGLAAVLLGLAGCAFPWSGPSTADTPEVRPSELEAADGRPCPEELPIGGDPSGHGFGVGEAADELPSLLEPQEAWVCQYDSYDAGSTGNGGTVLGWRRNGDPVPVPTDDLPDLQESLDDLALVDRSRDCPADLGPRWMVVHSHDGDLTGVVVDDYGCREVRLTDDPHTTPPGADGQDGTVPGVLDGGTAVLEALGVGRTS